MDDKSPASVLKEQLVLIGTLVVLIGTIYTDSYYSGFGLRYQSLSLPASHILDCALTAVVDIPILVLPYLICVGWRAVTSPRLGGLSVSLFHYANPHCRQPDQRVGS